ncbi:hypothetical protein LSH36_134g04034 [Paralvinella palmiformis]|uniref:Pyrimidine nucleoside phosphorylase C-terminal domain-containing protein n=1 Tax=Paralvinella palmiformis TaxID=53620 RepID=A0AAD9JWH9_9ANNE|nr:hypothetical protein LSH36_134g04034 [Paralvinella palmiformis]
MGSQDQNGYRFHREAMRPLSLPELISKKRDGRPFSKEEVQLFVDSVTDKSMQECQIEWNGYIVDKHSTGGVGDKISLPLAPALAACGLKVRLCISQVPMIAGRGLSFTGGTLDKLESIPGYNVYQSPESMKQLLDTVGCCIVGQTESLVPADKKLYAIRDVTGTVDSIPLITASIISKKGAEGLNSLVLDVYVGSSIGIKVTAMLTNMDRPIGYMIGNSLEIIETLQCLRGEGPASTRELTVQEGGYLLYNVGKASSPDEGSKMIAKSLSDGSAMAKFCQMLKAQGVSEENADKLCSKDSDVFSVIPKAKHRTDVPALHTGYVTDINALVCAKISYWLGSGRTRADGPIDHAVGLQLYVEVEDHITKGKPWITLHHNADLPDTYIDQLQEAITILPTVPKNFNEPLIIDVISE